MRHLLSGIHAEYLLLASVLLICSCAEPEQTDQQPVSGRHIVLTTTRTSAIGADTVVAPGHGKQRYTMYTIDTRAFENGGRISFDVSVGDGTCQASFDLFPEGAAIPVEGRPATSVAHVYDLGAGSAKSFDYDFDHGQIFQFGATGNWFSPEGAVNTYRFTVRVTRFD